MPTREQVLRLLESGLGYADVGGRLGISPGKAYLIATGLPADGHSALTATQARRPGVRPGSTQDLAHPESADPAARETVHRWLRWRALSDEQMRRAAGRHAGPTTEQDAERQ